MMPLLRMVYLVLAAPFRAGLYLVSLIGWSPRIAASLGEVSKNVAGTLIGGVIVWGCVAAGAYLGNPWRPSWPEPCSADRLCVLIAGLNGDTSGDQTRHVQASLESAFRNSKGQMVVQVITVPKKLRTKFGGDLERNREKAEQRGQSWLERMDAQVLVYGDVVDSNKVLDLHVLGRDDPRGRGRRYLLSDNLILPRDFDSDFGAALAGVATAAAVPASQTAQSVYVLDVLMPISMKLKKLTEAVPETAGWRSRGAIFYASAIAEEKIGLQSGNDSEEHLRSSIGSYKRALGEFTLERSPFDWAKAHHGMGNALAALGSFRGEKSYALEAIEEFRSALRVRTFIVARKDWAQTEISLASALGELETEAGFQEAEKILLEVVGSRDPPLDQIQQASALFALGELQMAWGQREETSKRLVAAAQAFNQAAESAPRTRAPLLWAAATVRLGDCDVVLGFRTGDTSYYSRAVTAYRAARGEFPRDRMPVQWAHTFGSEGQALQGWGESLDDTKIIADAVTAYRQGAMAFDRTRFPLQWAESQDRLSAALSSLAEREKNGLDHAREAISAAQSSLEARPRDRLPFLWARSQRHLGQALAIYAEKGGGVDSLGKAIAAFEAALTEFPKNKFPLEWAETKIAEGRAVVALGVAQSDRRSCEAGLVSMSNGMEVYKASGIPTEADANLMIGLQARCEALPSSQTATARTSAH